MKLIGLEKGDKNTLVVTMTRAELNEILSAAKKARKDADPFMEGSRELTHQTRWVGLWHEANSLRRNPAWVEIK